MENNNHAQLTITVSRHIEGTGMNAIKAELTGCKGCLASAISSLLLADKDFKELINKAIRAANEIKARSQN